MRIKETMLTYVDSSVLIAAFRGISPASTPANTLLADATRRFVTSDFVRLEVLPKATYHRNTTEVDFYNRYFVSVHLWMLTTPALIQLALLRGGEFGLSAVDALHVAAAELAGADELVTTEKAGKPLPRVTSVRVVSIHP
jgi:hypothetical protein